METKRKQRNQYQREYQKARWARRRIELINRLGGKCVKCGSTDNLEFDHIDPKTKSFTIASRPTASEDKMSKELAKCQLLCHTCHENKTYANTKMGRKMTAEERRLAKNEYTRLWAKRKRAAPSQQ